MSQNLDYFLEKTSRTFAICIPLLPPPIRKQVTIAYLLFRIVDTYEDAASWPPQFRIKALNDFTDLMDQQRPSAEFSPLSAIYAEAPTDHEGYIELLAATPQMIDQFYSLPERVQKIIWSHLKRTIEGMVHFLDASNEKGQVKLNNLSELECYCYTVAGIVGEMLTELFLYKPETQAAQPKGLLRLASSLGNGLQLTNILKDENADHSEGRFFLPATPSRKEIIAIARGKLKDGMEYIRELEKLKVPESIANACKLPTFLAQATIDKVEEFGPGAKISRAEVFAIMSRLAVQKDFG